MSPIRTLLSLFFLATTAMAFEIETKETLDIRVTLCEVDLAKDQIDLFLNDTSGHPYRTFSKLKSDLAKENKTILFAANAGMYHDDFSPVGLFVSQGLEASPLNLSKGSGNFFLKPNGVFYVLGQKAGILESETYARLKLHPDLATQSGPLLVNRGVLHPQFGPDSDSKKIRNGVGLQASGKVLLVMSEEPVNFHRFAILFRDGLACPDALYLDGTISGIYSPELKRNDSGYPYGPILAVTSAENE